MELIPGVQEGKRLTLDSLNRRIADLEGVVAELAKDFYSDTTPADSLVIDSAKVFTAGGCVTGPISEIDTTYVRSLEQDKKALTAEVARLVEERDQALSDVEFWNRESNAAEERAELYRDELEELRSTLRNL